jgi:hypothetical protein
MAVTGKRASPPSEPPINTIYQNSMKSEAKCIIFISIKSVCKGAAPVIFLALQLDALMGCEHLGSSSCGPTPPNTSKRLSHSGSPTIKSHLNTKDCDSQVLSALPGFGTACERKKSSSSVRSGPFSYACQQLFRIIWPSTPIFLV